MTNPTPKLSTGKKVLSIVLFMAAVIFNFIAIKILRNLSGESEALEYGWLVLFLVMGFSSLLFSQKLRVVKVEEGDSMES